VTRLNAQTDEDKATHGESTWTQVTEEDLRDIRILSGQELKISKYPEWLDVNKTGVKFVDEIKEENAFDLNKVPAEERESMQNTYTSETDPTTGVMEKENP
jgi:hypothetical protein